MIFPWPNIMRSKGRRFVPALCNIGIFGVLDDIGYAAPEMLKPGGVLDEDAWRDQRILGVMPVGPVTIPNGFAVAISGYDLPADFFEGISIPGVNNGQPLLTANRTGRLGQFYTSVGFTWWWWTNLPTRIPVAGELFIW